MKLLNFDFDSLEFQNVTEVYKTEEGESCLSTIDLNRNVQIGSPYPSKGKSFFIDLPYVHEGYTSPFLEEEVFIRLVTVSPTPPMIVCATDKEGLLVENDKALILTHFYAMQDILCDTTFRLFVPEDDKSKVEVLAQASVPVINTKKNKTVSFLEVPTSGIYFINDIAYSCETDKEVPTEELEQLLQSLVEYKVPDFGNNQTTEITA